MATEYYGFALKGSYKLLDRAIALLEKCEGAFPKENGANITIPRPDCVEEIKRDIDCFAIDAQDYMQNHQ